MKAKKTYAVRINNELHDVYPQLKKARAFIKAKMLTTDEDFTYEIVAEKTYAKVLIASSKLQEMQQQTNVAPPKVKAKAKVEVKPKNKRGRPKRVKEQSLEIAVTPKPVDSIATEEVWHADEEMAELYAMLDESLDANEEELDDVEMF